MRLRNIYNKNVIPTEVEGSRDSNEILRLPSVAQDDVLFMQLSIITVNTNDKENMLNQIASVMVGADGIEYEEIVSDNGSTDGSVDAIRQKFPVVKIVENGKNIGFGAANNSALPLATGEFLLFLNPDMRVEEGSLKKMIDWMQTNPKVGIASCTLVNEDGRFHEKAKPRRFPGLIDQIALLLKIPHIFPSILNRYVYKGFDPDKEQQVDSVRGSFLMMRRALVDKLGWAFDPRYFIWFEDVDICREAYRLGYTVMYTPIISCVDYVGQTFKRQPTMQKQKWFTESMLTYFKKWHPWYVWMWIALLRPVALGVTWVGGLFLKKKTWNGLTPHAE